jgi:hypothetical protein
MTSSASPPFGLYMLDVLIEGTDIAAYRSAFSFRGEVEQIGI